MLPGVGGGQGVMGGVQQGWPMEYSMQSGPYPHQFPTNVFDTMQPPMPLGLRPNSCSPTMSSPTMNAVSCLRATVAWCVRDLLPLSTPSKPGFFTLIRNLSPQFQPPSPDVLKEDFYRLNDVSIAQVSSSLVHGVVGWLVGMR